MSFMHACAAAPDVAEKENLVLRGDEAGTIDGGRVTRKGNDRP